MAATNGCKDGSTFLSTPVNECPHFMGPIDSCDP